jgi:hypothetical protein
MVVIRQRQKVKTYFLPDWQAEKSRRSLAFSGIKTTKTLMDGEGSSLVFNGLGGRLRLSPSPKHSRPKVGFHFWTQRLTP